MKLAGYENKKRVNSTQRARVVKLNEKYTRHQPSVSDILKEEVTFRAKNGTMQDIMTTDFFQITDVDRAQNRTLVVSPEATHIPFSYFNSPLSSNIQFDPSQVPSNEISQGPSHEPSFVQNSQRKYQRTIETEKKLSLLEDDFYRIVKERD